MDILKEMNETDLKSLAIDKTLDRQRILNALSGSDMNGGLQLPISKVNFTFYYFHAKFVKIITVHDVFSKFCYLKM